MRKLLDTILNGAGFVSTVITVLVTFLLLYEVATRYFIRVPACGPSISPCIQSATLHSSVRPGSREREAMSGSRSSRVYSIQSIGPLSWV